MRLGESNLGDGGDELQFSILKANPVAYVEVLCDENGQPTDNFPAGFGGCSGQAAMLGVSIQNASRFCYEVPDCSFSYGNACFETRTQCIEAEYSSGNFNFPKGSSSSSVVAVSSSSSGGFSSSSSSGLTCDQDPTDGFKYKGTGCPEYEIPKCSDPVVVQYPDGTEVVVQGPRIYEVVTRDSDYYPGGVNGSGCQEVRCGPEVSLVDSGSYPGKWGTTLVDVRLSGNSSTSSSSGASPFCCGVIYEVNDCGQLVMRCPDDAPPDLGCTGGGGTGGGGSGGGGGGGGGGVSSSISSFWDFSSSSS